MEFVQLTESLVHSVNGEKRTFFIGHQNGRYGVVAAGSWETVLPFRLRRISLLRDGSLAVFQGKRRAVYRIVETEEGVEVRRADRRGVNRPIGLPA